MHITCTACATRTSFREFLFNGRRCRICQRPLLWQTLDDEADFGASPLVVLNDEVDFQTWAAPLIVKLRGFGQRLGRVFLSIFAAIVTAKEQLERFAQRGLSPTLRHANDPANAPPEARYRLGRWG